ncbi:uncharacterized protein LOC121381294 [Gigantopelta aegis]|uniref:uncharacterized protein LOC121381294 n=1 Tax=Gigantopelta aegis TaxID=1735272 RepID=UPI001B88899A|nr:uncharacterized protein LOC121381294 [Gigantopelta aegis]
MKTDLSQDANHSTWAWQEVGTLANPCPRSRFKHAACLSGSYVYLYGGKDGRTPLKDFWRFNLGTLTWENLNIRGEQLPHLEGHTLVACQRLILIFGGQLSDGLHGPPLWILNTDLLLVRKISSDEEIGGGPTGRRDHTAVLYNSAMFVYGGFVDIKGSSTEFWMYSINEEQWSEVKVRSGETPGGRHGHSAVVEKNSMWLFGGMSGLTIKSEVWRFTFTMRTWQRVKCLGSPPLVTGHSAHVIDNVMYVIGGEIQGDLKNDVWCLPLDSFIWRKISTVQSVAVMPPCTQHASVWIDTRAVKHDSGNSRCVSEPYLQPPHNTDSLEMRPMSSPPVTSISNSRSAQFNQLAPATFRTEVLPHDHVTTMRRLYSRNCGYQTFYSRSEDNQALVRPASLDSERGLDNIVMCLQDEELLEGKDCEAIKYWNENSLVQIQANDRHLSVDASLKLSEVASRSCSNGDPTTTDQMNSHIYDKNNHGRKQYVHNSVITKQRRSSKSHPRETSENCPNPSKAIRSYLCNDLYVEDLEMVGVGDFIGCVKFIDEFNKKEHCCSESIELCDMSSNHIVDSSVDLNEVFSCDTDICHEMSDVCDSNSGSGNTWVVPGDEGCIVFCDDDRQPTHTDTHSVQDKRCLPVSHNTSCVPNQSNTNCITVQIDTNGQSVQGDTNCHPIQIDTNHQLIQNNTNGQPTQSDINFQLVTRNTSSQAIKSDTNHQPIQSDTNDRLIQSDTNDRLIQSDTNHQLIQSNTNHQPIQNNAEYNTNSRPPHSGKLVSTGTQTDMSEQCLRDYCSNQNVQQFYAKPHANEPMLPSFTDTDVCSGRLLVIGGKVIQGHFLSKPISLWAAEIV